MPEMTLPSSGDFGEGALAASGDLAMGDMAGFEGWRPDKWEMVEVADVCDATEGEEVRPPVGVEREAGKETGMKPVSWSSWGPEVSGFDCQYELEVFWAENG
jgi:hypothetical protein